MFKCVCRIYGGLLLILFATSQIYCSSAPESFMSSSRDSSRGRSRFTRSQGSGRGSNSELTKKSRSSGEKDHGIEDLKNTKSLRHQYFYMAASSSSSDEETESQKKKVKRRARSQSVPKLPSQNDFFSRKQFFLFR